MYFCRSSKRKVLNAVFNKIEKKSPSKIDHVTAEKLSVSYTVSEF